MKTTESLKVSVLIPTYNGGTLWAEVLKSINSQNYDFFKKVIVDSSSTDETRKLAVDYGFEVIIINKNDFNHGATRQQLIDASADSDICLLLTQDAVLASSDSAERIVGAFKDPNVGMAYGRQLPNPNAKALERHARLFNYPSHSAVVSINDFKSLGFKMFFCSNSFAAYRRSALEAVGGFPFDSIMGEDAIVAAKMLSGGFKKAYVAEATVYHSHSYTLIEEFRRYFDTRVFHEQNTWMLEKYGKPTSEGFKFIKSELKYVFKDSPVYVFKSIASITAKWLGYNTGYFFKRIPNRLLKKLSMHSFYWRK